jgi:hypothetical protein
MKKLLAILVLGLLLSSNAYAKSVKVFIENVKIDDVKSKLIGHHLDRGWDIEEETNNKITFSQKLEGMEAALVMTLMTGTSYPYSRFIYTILKKENGVTVYLSTEYFNSEEVVKLDGKKDLEDYQNFLNGFKRSF